jgi:hypothetical protein
MWIIFADFDEKYYEERKGVCLRYAKRADNVA